MKILLIVFAIIFIVVRLWTNYIKNDLVANIKYNLKGNIIFSLLVISEYILGAIIIIKVILKLFN